MKIHPRELALQNLASSPAPTRRAFVKHLTSCYRCRKRLASISALGPGLESLAEVLTWSGRGNADYERAIAAAERRCLVQARALAAERAEAPARLAELMEQPPERREMLMRYHRRFQTWGLLERLIEFAWEQCFEEPLAAESSAQLALFLTDVLDEDLYGAERIEDLRARAWGFVGNARRIRFELDSAEEALETAFTHLRQGTGDILERAFFLEFRASLLRARRRLAEAERLLLQALRIYREVGEAHRVGRTLVSLSVGYEMMGTSERSIPLLQEAVELIDAEQDPRLLWGAHHNLITALAETGRFMEAQGLLIQARPLYARFPGGHFLNRRHWVAGKIARGLGQIREAEAHLRAAREGFIALGATDDGALVSLELAALYAEQKRTVELKQIAQETLAIFSSRQIHREALAALSFLQQAVLAERASEELVTGVAAFLKRLQTDPELSFAQPS